MSTKTTFKIISFNIHSGTNFWMLPKLQSLIYFFKEQQPDILAIQEINENQLRGHQFSALQKALQLNGQSAPHVKIGKGFYGIATFSRFPIVKHSHLLLPSKKEQRGLLDTVYKVDGQYFHVLNTHLGLSNTERTDQIRSPKSKNISINLHHPFYSWETLI